MNRKGFVIKLVIILIIILVLMILGYVYIPKVIQYIGGWFDFSGIIPVD